MSTKFKRAILIDDDELDNFANRRVIDKSGLFQEILVFEYAEKALEFLESDASQPDLILLDVNMPRMNGFEFLDAYEKLAEDRRARAMVMMLSTSQNPQDLMRAKSYPSVVDFLAKPLTNELFIETVNRLPL